MEEKSGNTPNPLNPNSGGEAQPKAPATSRSIPVTAPVSANSIPEPEPQNINSQNFDTLNSKPQNPEPQNPEPQNTDPMARPMEKAPVSTTAPTKKKKTGLIIGAIVCLFLAIGCGVTAALLLLAPKTDSVAAALEKLFSGNRPQNISVKGDISFDINDNNSPFSKIDLDLDLSAVGNSNINSASAKLTALMRGGNEQVELNFQELYTNGGDLYLRIAGAADAIDALSTRQNILLPDHPECITDEETGKTNCKPAPTEVVDCASEDGCESPEVIDSASPEALAAISKYTDLIEVIDNEWIRISGEELSSMTGDLSEQSNLTCFTNLAKNSNSLANFYQDNQFIGSTNKNLTVASKNNPIFLIQIDDEKFTNFVNAASNSTITSEFFNCLGYENATIDASSIANEIKNLPDIYVEVDKNNNFSRIYFVAESEDDFTATVDLDLSYPDTINITEPVEYKDLTTILQDTSKTVLPAE